jgi:hypothetical protein
MSERRAVKVATIELAPDGELMTANQLRDVLLWVTQSWRDNVIDTMGQTLRIYKVVTK